MAQLLASYDDSAGDEVGPVQVSALLVHLLFLLVNGGSDSCTGLADTFGTEAFLVAAAAAEIPEEFRDDYAAR